METTNQLITMDDGERLIVNLGNAEKVYCSLKATTFEEKVAMFNAINAPEYRLSDCINQTIMVTDIYVESVQCVNEETGEGVMCPRIVLVDTEGKSYTCVSKGIYNSINKIIQIFGYPTWEAGMPLEIKQQNHKGNNKILTCRLNA